MRKGVAAVQHPGPVDALVNLRGEPADFAVARILPAGEHAAKQQGGVDGRQLAFPEPFAGAHVDEVIKKTALLRELFPEIAQRVGDAPENFPAIQVATFPRDAESGESKTRGGNAADLARVRAVGEAAVLHQAGGRIGGFPEIERGGALQFVQEAVSRREELRPDGARCGPGRESRGGQRCREQHLAARDLHPAIGPDWNSACGVCHRQTMYAWRRWRQPAL